MIRFLLHYGIHFLLPILIGMLFFKKQRWIVIIILLSGIIIDIDHLLATPVFDPNRCSLGYHPLHSFWILPVYLVLFLYRKTRIFGLALLIHILADAVDCLFLRS